MYVEKMSLVHEYITCVCAEIKTYRSQNDLCCNKR